MPASLPQIPEMDEKPTPAFRPPRDEQLRGRLPNANRVHRKDPQTGVWIEDEPAPLAAVDDLQSDDEVSAVRRDARAEIVKGEADLRRLAPAAMTDEKVRQECVNIQSRVRAARDVLELDDLAQEETARLDAEALAAAAEKRRLAARREADKLVSQRVQVMRRFDEAARALAQALVECEALSLQADQKMQAAGDAPGAGMLGPGSYETALRYALAGAGVAARALRFEGASAGQLGPLAPEPAKS